MKHAHVVYLNKQKMKSSLDSATLYIAVPSQVVNLHMNFGCHLNFCYLTCLLDRNPLLHTSHFHISRFLISRTPLPNNDCHSALRLSNLEKRQ